MNSPTPAQAAPLGDLALHVLLSLGDGPAHGYGLGKDIEARTGGRLNPTTGALYQVLRRLAEEGLIEAIADPPEPSPDARRKYFALTAAGRTAVALEAQRLEALLSAARQKKLYPASA